MRSRILLVVPVLIGLLLAPVQVAPSGAAASAPEWRLGAPKNGQCYNATNKEAYTKPSTRSKPVSCQKRHNLWVVKVLKVPSRIKLNGNQVFGWSRKPCGRAMVKAVGAKGTRWARGAYDGFTFVPTSKQQKQGARWVACLVGIVKGPQRLVYTKGKLTKIGSSIPRDVRLCLNRKGQFTTCATSDFLQVKKVVARQATRRTALRRAGEYCFSYFPPSDRTWSYAWRRIPMTDNWYAFLCFND